MPRRSCATRCTRAAVGTHSPLGTVQKAAAQLEQAAQEAGAPSPAARGVQRVQIERPRFDIQDHLWDGTLGLASLVGQATIVVFLTYFLLVSGDTFRRKLVKLTGPSLSNKKITVQALDEITQQIQRYLLVQLLSSVVVGVATALAFWALGLKHAAVWGIAAAILNLIPYIGSAVVAGAAALVAFVQFGELNMAAGDGRRLAGDPHRAGQPDRAVADQQDQPHESGRGLHRRARPGAGCGVSGACCWEFPS